MTTKGDLDLLALMLAWVVDVKTARKHMDRKTVDRLRALSGPYLDDIRRLPLYRGMKIVGVKDLLPVVRGIAKGENGVETDSRHMVESWTTVPSTALGFLSHSVREKELGVLLSRHIGNPRDLVFPFASGRMRRDIDATLGSVGDRKEIEDALRRAGAENNSRQMILQAKDYLQDEYEVLMISRPRKHMLADIEALSISLSGPYASRQFRMRLLESIEESGHAVDFLDDRIETYYTSEDDAPLWVNIFLGRGGRAVFAYSSQGDRNLRLARDMKRSPA